MAQAEEVLQTIVAGKYRLTRLIGRGGMGSVWEGTHTTLGTHVAVKFIDSEYAESAEARSRFENEARAAAKLRSKHVVEVYDHGVTADGRPFIVMEYLRGEPLDKRLDRVGRMPAKDAARLLMQVCRALSKAHAAGIVHRDLKPENIFLVWDDEDGADVVKVVDFGIAKFTDNSLGSSSATRTGSVLGTPYYMSPEQARGLRSVDHRSDLWSVGVIAFRCIIGQLPFEGEAVGDLLVKLCTAPIPVPSQLDPTVPPGFDAWFAKALSREPEQRFASASELGESLGAVCGLSVRGSYATGDNPIPSFASGPMASATPAITPSESLVVKPDYRSAQGSQPVALGSSQSTLHMATGAPTTQTPSPGRSTSTGALVAVAAVAVIVLGIGAAALFKLSGRAEVAASPPSSAKVTEIAESKSAPPAPAAAPVPAPAASAASSAAPSAAISATPPQGAAASSKPIAPRVSAPFVQPLKNKPPAARPNGAARPVDDMGF